MISKIKYDFGIRVNLGNEVGSGHFYRCLSIAKKLIEQKRKVIFIVNDLKEIKSHLSGDKISYIVLKSKNENQRVNECKKLSNIISKLIIDLPFENETYSKKLQNDFQTIIIDDIGNKKIFSKILFNGQIIKKYHKYSMNKKTTISFLGTKYMILRPEFETFRKKVSSPKKEIQNILLTFGGTDDNDITNGILPYFYDKNYNITIVIGPSYKNHKKINQMIKGKKKIKLIINEKNMAKLFSKQDLVISSSGITAYELACLGIPSIFIPSDKYQKQIAKEITKNGFGVNFGHWEKDFKKIEKIILSIEKSKIRKKMYIQGRKILDGKGLTRIVNEISKL